MKKLITYTWRVIFLSLFLETNKITKGQIN